MRRPNRGASAGARRDVDGRQIREGGLGPGLPAVACSPTSRGPDRERQRLAVRRGRQRRPGGRPGRVGLLRQGLERSTLRPGGIAWSMRPFPFTLGQPREADSGQGCIAITAAITQLPERSDQFITVAPEFGGIYVIGDLWAVSVPNEGVGMLVRNRYGRSDEVALPGGLGIGLTGSFHRTRGGPIDTMSAGNSPRGLAQPGWLAAPRSLASVAPDSTSRTQLIRTVPFSGVPVLCRMRR